MQIISSGSYQGIGKYNNDIINSFTNMCYVIDGASAVFNDNIFFKTSDLYEYMRLLKQNISNNDTIINSLKNAIRNSNQILENINKYIEYELPTFTIAVIKEIHNYFETYLLCDCLISILYKNGTIENIEDKRFDKVKIECRKEIKEINKLNLSDKEKLKLKRNIWRKYRKFANNEGGYPVGSTNEISVENGIINKIDKKVVDKILICTDGLYNLVGIPTNKEYFDKDILEEKIKNSTHNDDLSYYLISNN